MWPGWLCQQPIHNRLAGPLQVHWWPGPTVAASNAPTSLQWMWPPARPTPCSGQGEGLPCEGLSSEGLRSERLSFEDLPCEGLSFEGLPSRVVRATEGWRWGATASGLEDALHCV